MMQRQVKILLIIEKEACHNQDILQKMKLIKHLKHWKRLRKKLKKVYKDTNRIENK